MVLITVYGPQAVEERIREALDNGIIGAHHLERMLEQREIPENTKPEPLILVDERLKIPPYIPNLQTYDALLLENEPGKDEEETL
jgi:hypothetical protein